MAHDITLKDVAKKYHNSQENALSGITLNIDIGDKIAITGPSGSGKTTLLKVIGQYARHTAGEVTINGEVTDGMSERHIRILHNAYFGYVLQNYALIGEKTVADNVELPLLFSKTKVKRAERIERVDAMLNELHIYKEKGTLAKKLSGGQKQLVAIARCLINDPTIILADEPTGSLDSYNSAYIIDTLLEKVNCPPSPDKVFQKRMTH